MNKIVVTGGLGFIGSNLVELLIKNGFFVINIDKISYASNFYNTLDFKNNRNYKFFKLDINNKSKLLKIFKKYKPVGIFNLAAETHVDRSIDGPGEFIQTNVVGTYTLLEQARAYWSMLDDGKKVNWRDQLTKKLFDLQKPDGSWINENGRWWEKDPVLTTCYSLLCLQRMYSRL